MESKKKIFQKWKIAVTGVSTDYHCSPVKPKKAPVRFYLRAITICVSSLWFWNCTWNLLTSSMTKASNKTLVLPSFFSPPNSLYRLVQKFQLLIQNSILSASWTLLPTSWRNLSCYIGQTQDLGTAAMATSVGKKKELREALVLQKATPLFTSAGKDDWSGVEYLL